MPITAIELLSAVFNDLYLDRDIVSASGKHQLRVTTITMDLEDESPQISFHGIAPSGKARQWTRGLYDALPLILPVPSEQGPPGNEIPPAADTLDIPLLSPTPVPPPL